METGKISTIGQWKEILIWPSVLGGNLMEVTLQLT
jgi:hypothetical protein